MRRLLLLLSVVVAVSACEKNDSDDNDPQDASIYGRYTGTFYRTGMDTVEVDLSLLSTNRFEGSSTKQYYPAICGGNFTFDGNTITVNDTCSWTANFDWTLIFDGSYNVSFIDNNSVRIWRNSGTFTDEYLLNKFVR